MKKGYAPSTRSVGIFQSPPGEPAGPHHFDPWSKAHKEAKKTKLETREKEKGPDLQFDFLQVDIMKIKEQSTDKVMTNSQKFILDLGYTGQCSTKEAVVWHYRALRRQFDFTRHEVETRPGGWGGAVEDSSTAEKEDHARALNEIGPFEFLITEEEWKAGLPEEVDSLVWKWVL